MARRPRSPFDTATSPATATMTITINPDSSAQPETVPVATLNLKPTRKTSENRHIHWSEDTVDNEDLNKKKSNRKKLGNLIKLR